MSELTTIFHVLIQLSVVYKPNLDSSIAMY